MKAKGRQMKMMSRACAMKEAHLPMMMRPEVCLVRSRSSLLRDSSSSLMEKSARKGMAPATTNIRKVQKMLLQTPELIRVPSPVGSGMKLNRKNRASAAGTG